MKRAIALIAALLALIGASRAEYVLCTPDGEVNVRKNPRIKSTAIAGLSFGMFVETDGKVKNGFAHVIDLPAEDTSGWVSTGYLVKDEPMACTLTGYAVGLGKILARKNINGKVVKRIEPGSEVIIFAYSQEWCVTEYGFIRTEFLEIPQQEDRDRRGEVR